VTGSPVFRRFSNIVAAANNPSAFACSSASNPDRQSSVRMPKRSDALRRALHPEARP
jgi:hypothetical protein